MSEEKFSRRSFLKVASVAAAATVLGLGGTACETTPTPGAKKAEPTAKNTEPPKKTVGFSTDLPEPQPIDKGTAVPVPKTEEAIETVAPTKVEAPKATDLPPSPTPLPETVVGGAGGEYGEKQKEIMERGGYKAKKRKLLDWFK